MYHFLHPPVPFSLGASIFLGFLLSNSLTLSHYINKRAAITTVKQRKANSWINMDAFEISVVLRVFCLAVKLGPFFVPFRVVNIFRYIFFHYLSVCCTKPAPYGNLIQEEPL
jgi:hypothetical protein